WFKRLQLLGAKRSRRNRLGECRTTALFPEGRLYEHTSILKFIEAVFGLPTLASINHLFDSSTPVGSNYQAAATGAAAGPPPPPRDNRTDIGNLLECFTF